jgi:dipeptidyl aminopeptidase/acylaminoacyl peptidase
LVLAIHGGPYWRDRWGFSSIHQWLADRGYAVLSVNYRGSTGYGKAFITAADHEWGGKMHDDLIDAVNWGVTQGIADPKRIGFVGASYGGYSALTALTRTPEVFACIVDLFGIANLITFMASIPLPCRGSLRSRSGAARRRRARAQPGADPDCRNRTGS